MLPLLDVQRFMHGKLAGAAWLAPALHGMVRHTCSYQPRCGCAHTGRCLTHRGGRDGERRGGSRGQAGGQWQAGGGGWCSAGEGTMLWHTGAWADAYELRFAALHRSAASFLAAISPPPPAPTSTIQQGVRSSNGAASRPSGACAADHAAEQQPAAEEEDAAPALRSRWLVQDGEGEEEEEGGGGGVAGLPRPAKRLHTLGVSDADILHDLNTALASEAAPQAASSSGRAGEGGRAAGVPKPLKSALRGGVGEGQLGPSLKPSRKRVRWPDDEGGAAGREEQHAQEGAGPPKQVRGTRVLAALAALLGVAGSCQWFCLSCVGTVLKWALGCCTPRSLLKCTTWKAWGRKTERQPSSTWTTPRPS